MDIPDNSMYDFDMDISMLDIQVLTANPGHLQPSWYWHSPETNLWSGFVLWLIKDGRGTLKESDSEYTLTRGDCFLLRHSDYHHGKHNPEYPLVVPWIIFDLLDKKGNPYHPSAGELPVHRTIQDFPLVSSLVDRCIRDFADSPEKAAAWLRVILMEIVTQNDISDEYCVDRYYREIIDSWCLQVYSAPGRYYSIDQIASKAGCSLDHFIRLFRTYKGTSPLKYVIRIRMEAARNLLRYSGLRVNQVSQKLGYCDPYYFSRQFKRYTGINPSKCRSSIDEIE